MLIFQTQSGLYALAIMSAWRFPMYFSVFKGHLTDKDWTAGCIQQDWSVSHTRENERFFEDRLSQNNLLTNSPSLTVPDVFLWGLLTQNSVCLLSQRRHSLGDCQHVNMYLPIWSITSSCVLMPETTTFSILCDGMEFLKD
jgi:hypothetical protein